MLLSPFSELDSRLDSHIDYDGYEACSGELGDISENLSNIAERILKEGNFENMSLEDLFFFIYSPTVIFRILGELTRNNDEYGYQGVIDAIKEKCYRILPGMLALDKKSLVKVLQLKEYIGNSDPLMLSEYGEYSIDRVSLASSDAGISVRTGAKIYDAINPSRRNVFLALGNGGVSPGIQVFNKLQNLGAIHTQFATAIFSTRKEDDIKPVLSDSELIDLLLYCEQGSFIVFDEDSDSGQTLDKAEEFFHKRKLPSTDLIVLSNCGTYEQSEDNSYLELT